MSQEVLFVLAFACGMSLGFALCQFLQGKASVEQTVRLILNDNFAKLADEFYARQDEQGKSNVEIVKHFATLLHNSVPSGATAVIDEFAKQVDGKPNVPKAEVVDSVEHTFTETKTVLLKAD